MQRREFIIFLGGAAAAWPLIARAQQPTKVVRIGVLAYSAFPPLQRFAHKLREHGYIEGQNLRFEPRFAEGRDDHYPALAAELIAVPVDIIVTWGTLAAIAAKQATSTIPIVFSSIYDQFPAPALVERSARSRQVPRCRSGDVAASCYGPPN